MNIIKKALEYYDKNNEKYDSFLSKVKYFGYQQKSGDMDRSIIIMYDKNKKKLFESRLEHVGLYHGNSKLWAWAWANPTNLKNVSYISRKIFDYGMNLDPETENLFLKTELTTSRLRISHPVQLDVHIALSSYLAKMPLIFKAIYFPGYETTETGFRYFRYFDDSEILPYHQKYQIRYLFILDFEKLDKIINKK